MNIFKQNKNSYILNSNSHLNDNLDELLDMNKSQVIYMTSINDKKDSLVISK